MKTNITPDHILSLEAGEELDRLHMKYVMKFQLYNSIFSPSRWIGDAWMGIEELQRRGPGSLETMQAYLPEDKSLIEMTDKEAALAITRACVIAALIAEDV